MTRALETTTGQFVDEIIGLLRLATVDDLMEIGQVEPAPTAQAERPVNEAPTGEPEPRATTASSTPTTPRKTRTWPTCSAPGCTGKMYGPSGSKRLCYQHHLEGGGKLSPFSRKRSKADEADEGPQPAVEARQGGENDPDGPGEREGVPAAVEGPGQARWQWTALPSPRSREVPQLLLRRLWRPRPASLHLRHRDGPSRTSGALPWTHRCLSGARGRTGARREPSLQPEGWTRPRPCSTCPGAGGTSSCGSRTPTRNIPDAAAV